MDTVKNLIKLLSPRFWQPFPVLRQSSRRNSSGMKANSYENVSDDFDMEFPWKIVGILKRYLDSRIGSPNKLLSGIIETVTKNCP